MGKERKGKGDPRVEGGEALEGRGEERVEEGEVQVGEGFAVLVEGEEDLDEGKARGRGSRSGKTIALIYASRCVLVTLVAHDRVWSMRSRPTVATPPTGPHRADALRPKDPYEISDGHLIHCLPTGQRGGRSTVAGALVLDTDPAVESSGIDTGFSPRPSMLRAPDIAVGNVEDKPGWASAAPPLAVEYADTGQDEADLRTKIGELLREGTRFVWVVRLRGTLKRWLEVAVVAGSSVEALR